ncbi:hypothetical protein [Maribacter sp. 2210JD10-5]|uniref:hypothetical protein n=1 Tax=Maribacter sp. 2210JD10-5 TaxID=3386272 RepID=UPI0039BD4472
MQPKKYRDKDLNPKTGLYFVIALLLLLAIVFIALEWKTIHDTNGYEVENAPEKESIILETKAT